MNQFQVKHEKFEGPLAVILELIQERKLHISELSLAEITDAFLNYISTSPEFPISESAEFLVIAATLLLIKSRSLLPGLNLNSNEEADIIQLEARLELYKIHQEACQSLCTKWRKNNLLFPRTRDRPIVFIPPRVDTCTIDTLKHTMQALLEMIPSIQKLPQTTIQKIISLEMIMENVLLRVTQGLSLSLKDISDSSNQQFAKKQDMIVGHFLALLELLRRGKVAATQSGTFHDILIESNNITTPNYGYSYG